jgi:hypothetical protein
MKRIASFLSLAAALMVVATGCLKDKDFDAQRYGIQIADVKAVAFPNANASPLSYGLDVSASPQVVNNLLFVTLETASVAESDVNVTITNATGTQAAGLIAQYNADHGTNVQVLDPSLWSIPFNTTISAGSKNVMLPLTITNTTTLNPNLSYGIALTITQSSSGFQIAENQKTVLVIFSVKNKYDGVYLLTGFHNRTPYTFPYETEVHLITTGPSSVIFYWPDAGSVGHPIGVGVGSMSWYGPTVAPNIEFDPATDLVTNVFNSGIGGPPIDMFPGPYDGVTTPPGPRIMRFDPADRSILVDWRYSANNLRAFFDNLEYIGPR